jgi:hypothetical protein
MVHMIRIPTLARSNAFVSLSIWLAISAPALGQAGGEVVTTKEAWVMPYALVILCIGLGIFVISRHIRRES